MASTDLLAANGIGEGGRSQSALVLEEAILELQGLKHCVGVLFHFVGGDTGCAQHDFPLIGEAHKLA